MKILNKIFKTLPILFCILFLVSCSSADKKLFDEALKLQSDEKYEDAIGQYKNIIDTYPDSKFVSNSNVKLNQCVDSLIKQGDDMASQTDYFKAVFYYDTALKYRSNDIDLQNKKNDTKNLATSTNGKTETTNSTKEKAEKTESTDTKTSSENEYNIALDSLNKYKGKKVQEFDHVSKILEMLMDWEEAWESQNINLYKAYYAPNFIGVNSGQTMNYTQWMSYKNSLFNKYSSIKIQTQLIDAVLEGNNLKVYFDQWFNGYGSNPYSDKSSKELIFQYNDQKGWLIISEKPY